MPKWQAHSALLCMRVCVCKCSICLGAWLTHNYYVDAHTQARTSTHTLSELPNWQIDKQLQRHIYVCVCVCVCVSVCLCVFIILQLKQHATIEISLHISQA